MVGGEICLEQKENKTYSVTAEFNKYLLDSVQAFGEVQTFADDAEICASINLFLVIYH